MADNKASQNKLEKQSSLDSYQSTGEGERQTANWMEVKIIGSGGFGNVTLWKNKVCPNESVYYVGRIYSAVPAVGVACINIFPNKDYLSLYSMMELTW